MLVRKIFITGLIGGIAYYLTNLTNRNYSAGMGEAAETGVALLGVSS